MSISNCAVPGKSKDLKIRVRNNNDTERRANNFFIGEGFKCTPFKRNFVELVTYLMRLGFLEPRKEETL